MALAREAGEMIKSGFRGAVDPQRKADGTPVTATDFAVNRLVVESVASTYPDHDVIGEEESHSATGGGEWAWICDPIDGTIPFASGLPLSTFVLALTRHGVP